MIQYKIPKFKIGNIVNTANIKYNGWYQHIRGISNLKPKNEDFTKINYIITKVNYIPPLNTNLNIRYELKNTITKEKINLDENLIKINLIHQRNQKLKIINKK
jgi:hypothetical protein